MGKMISAVIMGIVCVYLGISAIVEREWCLRSYSPYCFEFGTFSPIVGTFMILFGVAYFLAELRRREREKGGKEKE
jgi:hypothetical protein